MLPKFLQFIREQQYLQNVTPATIEWYKHAFKWLTGETPTQNGCALLSATRLASEG